MSLTLASALAPYVGASIRGRGEHYFRNGRVATVGADRRRMYAVVHGSRHYDVALELDGTALVASCTCPHFADNVGACKHIWATILQASEARTLEVPDHLWLNAVGVTRTLPRTAAVVEPWRAFLAYVAEDGDDAVTPRSPLGEIVYVTDGARIGMAEGLRLELLTRVRRKSGEWGKPKAVRMNRHDLATLPDARDRDLLERLIGAARTDLAPWQRDGDAVPQSIVLSSLLQRELIAALCDTGRFLLSVPATTRKADTTYLPIGYDPTPATFTLRIEPGEGGYRVDGTFTCGGQPVALADVAFVSEALVIWRPGARGALPYASPADSGGAERWLEELRRVGPITVPAAGATALAEAVAASDMTRVEIPGDLRLTPRLETPQSMVRFGVRALERRRWSTTPPDRLDVDVTFSYGGVEVDARAPQRILFSEGGQTAWRRDLQAEHLALARLEALGVRRLADWDQGGTRFDVAASLVPDVARRLIGEGWRVESEGQTYVRPGAMDLEVRSGIDWFELRGAVDFGGIRVDVPALLDAVRNRDGLVRLGDGTFGVLPDSWLQKVGRVAAFGVAAGSGVRFARAQGPLLDAWLEDQPQVDVDETFQRLRQELAQFERIREVPPPPGFTGALRPYQREALGWFAFLRQFGFGGCLADEMGLGKTVMVLAALEARRLDREAAGAAAQPSLVVVPRSLVFNWTREAARFAPDLRVLDLTGADRRSLLDAVAGHDLVLTTYGTLRRDVTHLADIEFDYLILDEAQAIKNRASHTARAAKVLKGRHRLALTGTPVENHIGELWSLFEFLNPGMLGSIKALNEETPAAGGTTPAQAEDALTLVAR
ncbi:MAG TPA: SNF2-related protein, partial [Luteitalea sp.]|nr:SNF2-related protein [Luteitalea sp.]